MDTSYRYMVNTPAWMRFVAALLFVVAIVVGATALRSGASALALSGEPIMSLTELGQLGDFFGGHIAAFVGSTTLLVVLFFSYHQGKQQERFFTQQEALTAYNAQRQSFLDGINLITQWDIQNPGCDQAMRLLDYYARLALRSSDEELLLLLNTVITAEIRKNLQDKNGSYKSTNYPFACEAIERIRPLRERDGRAQRMRLKSLMDLSVDGRA